MTELVFCRATYDYSKAVELSINGKTYVRIPVVMARVGEMNGLHYSANVLENSVSEWDGIDVSFNHPRNDKGEPVSINADKDTEKEKVGTVNDTVFEKDALKCNAIVDKYELKTKNPNAMNPNVHTDVSLAAFIKKDKNNNVISMIPDHLALLANEKGACSVEDGCGTFVAASEESNGKKFSFKAIQRAFNTIVKGESLRDRLQYIINDSNEGDSEILDVDKENGYLVWKSEDEFIWKQDYIENSNNINLGEKERVTRVVTYEPVKESDVMSGTQVTTNCDQNTVMAINQTLTQVMDAIKAITDQVETMNKNQQELAANMDRVTKAPLIANAKAKHKHLKDEDLLNLSEDVLKVLGQGNEESVQAGRNGNPTVNEFEQRTVQGFLSQKGGDNGGN